MLAVHHMHLTQLTLKTMAIGLGGNSLSTILDTGDTDNCFQ
jgi:hypothetical protein